MILIFSYRKRAPGDDWNSGKCKSCYFATKIYPFITCKDLYPRGKYAEHKRTAEEKSKRT